MSRPWQRYLDEHDLMFWMTWLDEIGDEEIANLDLKECYSMQEVEHFGLSKLPRVEQARVLRVLDINLTRRKTADSSAPGAVQLRDDVERHIRLEEGHSLYLVSVLQVRTCMRILGYRRTGTIRGGRYNVSMVSLNRWHRRMAGMRRMPTRSRKGRAS